MMGTFLIFIYVQGIALKYTIVMTLFPLNSGHLLIMEFECTL